MARRVPLPLVNHELVPRSPGEDEERAVRHLLEVLVTRSGDGLFVKDLDGRYVFANAAAAAMVERTVETLVGATDDDVFRPETVREIREVDRRVARTGRPHTYEPVRLEFGAPRVFQTTKYPYVGSDGTTQGVLGVSRDVTGIADALSRASEASARFEALVNGLPELVLVLAEGQVRFANRAAYEVLGWKEGDLPGREAQAICPTCQVDPGAEGLPALVRLTRADGSHLQAEVTRVDLAFQGAPAQLIVARDVTARHELQARLARADRLATAGTLAAGLAHEINNPLTCVMMLLDQALEEARGLPQGGALSDALVDALEGAERIAGLVRDLSAFARVEPGAAGTVDPLGAAEKAARMARVRLKGLARLELDLEPVAPVPVAGSGLWQVLLNLLLNAANAVGRAPPGEHLVHLALRQVGPVVEAVVEDSGPGIPTAVQAQLFEPFFTGGGGTDGSGLGLSIAHSIVTEAGGTLTAENRPEGGARFVVRLPALEGPFAPQARQGAAWVPDTALPPVRVLVVEDEVRLGRAVVDILETLGTVRLAATAAEARAALEEDPDWDLVLCDLVLPDGTGQELYEAAGPDQARRFLFMTGGAPTPELRAFLARQPQEVVTKPFVASDLLARVRRWLLARPASPDPAGPGA